MKIYNFLFLSVFHLPFVLNNPGYQENRSDLSSVTSSIDSLSEIRAIMRADDIGFSHAANVATIKAYKEGVITSTEILVVCPWFLEAAKLLNENPELDVGVHLALTSEWDNYKWGPLTMSKSLVTIDGYFASDNNSFLALDPDLKEVEYEMHAQVELALKYIPHISHLSFHMGTGGATLNLLAIAKKVSKEFNLPLEDENVNGYDELWAVAIEKKEEYLANALNNLKKGTTAFVFHLAENNSESQSISGTTFDANIRMALHREAETKAVTSRSIKQIIKKRKIKLVTYTGKEKEI